MISLNSFNLDKINVTRKGNDGYPKENNKEENTKEGDDADDNKYAFIPGLLLPTSLCIFLCVLSSLCLRSGTCHFKAWIK